MNDTGVTPQVSVIIPVYCASEQHETYLAEALESVARQTFRDFEVIIVDDVSPRDIRPVLDKIDGLPGMHHIRNEANLGHARSRNTGVQAAAGEFLTFLDHDDLWAPEKLAKQVLGLKNEPGAGMIFSAVNVFGPYAHRLSIDQSIIPSHPDFIWLINHGNFVITSSAAMVRRDTLMKIGLFDPRYSTCDDFDAWLKIARVSSMVYMPEALAFYRLHSMNANYGVDRLNDNILLTKLLMDYWCSAPIAEKIELLPRIGRKVLGRAYFHMFRHRRFKD
ncbi:MAG: glycosyltransferase family 2 protein [Armatimonadota bacterium]